MAEDPYDLTRFLDAQHNVIDTVRAELRRGRKTSHWMWFVFPQLAGLGRSSTAQYYAISGPAEARAYLAHPVLGARLHECVQAVLDAPTADADALLGPVDALKLRSCLTLFARVAPDGTRFTAALAKYYDGQQDPATVRLLGG